MKFSHLVMTLFCVAALSISSCKLYAPTFKTVNNLKLERVNTMGIKLGADAVFNNPNPLKFRVKDIAVDVILDNKLIGTLGEKTVILIARKSDFTIPLGIALKPDGSLFDNLKNLLGFIKDKEADVALVGKIQVKWFLFKKTVPIQYKQKIKLSQVK